MKYLMMIALMLMISCGGELPKNCGDGILQSDEVCEVGQESRCDRLGFNNVRMVDCAEDCSGYDISVCMED